MSKDAKKSDTAPAMVRVRITVNRTEAAGLIHAKGAKVMLPEQQARTLEELGLAVIVGV